MASITKLPSGRWRAQIRQRQKSASKTFRIRADADRWATEQQDRLNRGEGINKRLPDSVGTLGDMIDLHLTDMADVGKEARRSKEATLLRLKDTIGTIRLPNLTRERIIEFGRDRAKEGAGPATLAIDLSFINTVLKHASAIYGYSVPTEQVRLGRNALVILGLIGKSTERDRRPTEKELSRILAFFRT
ncbi:MAG: hypothetical protein ABL893_06625, partial [Hyphomicrobium sp.]